MTPRSPWIGLFVAVITAAAKPAAGAPVVVYTYDSFASKGSLGPRVAAAAKARFNVETELVSFPSAGEALNQLAIEGKKTRADLVVGVDQSFLSRAREIGAFEILDKALLAKVPEDLRFDSKGELVPFDHGYLTLVYDSRRVTPPKGMSLADFASHEGYAKKLVIQDPRTSSIGLAMLLWTRALFEGNSFEKFWKGLSRRVLTVSPGWSGAYGLFLKGEADFVVSYTTSPAYHKEKEKTDFIRGMDFPEGHYRQVEAAGLVRGSSKKAQAKQWLETLLSDGIQKELPTLQWMYPVVKGTPLPESFLKLPKVARTLVLSEDAIAKSKREWVRQWTILMTRKP